MELVLGLEEAEVDLSIKEEGLKGVRRAVLGLEGSHRLGLLLEIDEGEVGLGGDMGGSAGGTLHGHARNSPELLEYLLQTTLVTLLQ